MLLPILVLVVSFVFLFKCANYIVDGAISISHITRTPKLIVGIIVVGFATTAPELAVSVMASALGHSAIALGNAVGSVICDDALALGLAAAVAASALTVSPRLLKSVALFIIGIDILVYALIFNGHIGRAEGALLLAILFIYYAFILVREKKRRKSDGGAVPVERGALKKTVLILALGVAGVVIASRGVVWAAVSLAQLLGISDAVIGLTIVAIGTSLPEISTCLTAAFRGEGEIAIGDILGADILNVLWVIGMSALVNPIVVERKIINFAFPWMLGIVALTLLFLRIGYRLGKGKGIVLVALYCVYIVWTIARFY